jgi:hypothetical protein
MPIAMTDFHEYVVECARDGVYTANAREQSELNVDEREEWCLFLGDVPCFRSRGLRFNDCALLSAVPDRRDHRVSHFFGGKKGPIALFFFLFC